MSFTAKPFHAHKQFQSSLIIANLIDDLAAVLDNQIVLLQRLRALDAPPATLRLAQSARGHRIGGQTQPCKQMVRVSQTIKASIIDLILDPKKMFLVCVV